jgi:hypothetical protein
LFRGERSYGDVFLFFGHAVPLPAVDLILGLGGVAHSHVCAKVHSRKRPRRQRRLLIVGDIADVPVKIGLNVSLVTGSFDVQCLVVRVARLPVERAGEALFYLSPIGLDGDVPAGVFDFAAEEEALYVRALRASAMHSDTRELTDIPFPRSSPT